MLAFVVLLQIQAADSVYSTAALRAFVEQASIANRAPPPSLAGYRAHVESELALILRDSLGREIVGQIEQIAARAEWERFTGKYDLHVVGFRSQSAGAPYSALTWTKMYTVPTLYGNRLFIGLNDGVAWTRRDSNLVRRRAREDSLAGRARRRVIHPLAADRDRYYRFSGGDTVATIYSRGRAIRIVRVYVDTVRFAQANYFAFVGELDFDADRHQLVRMRGRLEDVTTRRDPLFVRTMGAQAAAYLEYENAEINGQYWLPAYQRSEFQAQMGMLGDVRPVYRIISRFREYQTTDTVVPLAGMDSLPPMPRTQAKMTYASKDSVGKYTAWQEPLGVASARVTADDFDDIALDVWRPTGKPRVDYWPKKLDELVRYNRVEGMFTGMSTQVRFRDLVPGLHASANAGWAWSAQTIHGAAAVSLTRANWIYGARIERSITSTDDFLSALDNGLSIGPLIAGVDNSDYVGRRIAGLSLARIIGNVDRALFTTEAAYVQDVNEIARVSTAPIYGKLFRPNRVATPGRYARGQTLLEWHPRVTGASVSPGLGARVLYEVAAGDLDWQRVEVRLAGRRHWHSLVFASSVDAGAVFASTIPPQTLYELGGGNDLPAYEYKEFGGDRAALGRSLIAYHFPFLRRPFRLGPVVIPGISPGIGTGVRGGWAQASSAAARQALLALGGDGVTPLSRPSDHVRATADVRFTLLSGVLGAGLARAIDHPDRWKPFFGFGLAF